MRQASWKSFSPALPIGAICSALVCVKFNTGTCPCPEHRYMYIPTCIYAFLHYYGVFMSATVPEVYSYSIPTHLPSLSTIPQLSCIWQLLLTTQMHIYSSFIGSWVFNGQFSLKEISPLIGTMLSRAWNKLNVILIWYSIWAMAVSF